MEEGMDSPRACCELPRLLDDSGAGSLAILAWCKRSRQVRGKRRTARPQAQLAPQVLPVESHRRQRHEQGLGDLARALARSDKVRDLVLSLTETYFAARERVQWRSQRVGEFPEIPYRRIGVDHLGSGPQPSPQRLE